MAVRRKRHDVHCKQSALYQDVVDDEGIQLVVDMVWPAKEEKKKKKAKSKKDFDFTKYDA